MDRKLFAFTKKLRPIPVWQRRTIGTLLLIGGAFWFLPILGLWMIPLGLFLMSRDFDWARRGYISILVWLRRRRRRKIKDG